MTGIPSSNLHRLIIPDDVLIQFDLPMMSAVTLRTCRDMKQVSDYLVCQSGLPSSHLHRLIIPDDVLIQFNLLMMSAVTIETCRYMKQINTGKMCQVGY